MAAVLGAGAAMGMSGYALAAGSVDNSAIASGTYGGNPIDSTASTATVPLADPTIQLAVTKTGVLNDVNSDGVINGADTITYTVDVTNNSNITVTNVTPQEDGITFAAVAGGGTFGTFSPANVASLAPSATASFTITYDLTDVDAFRAAGVTDGVENTATVNATTPGGPASGTDTSQNTITAVPRLAVAKAAAITTDNGTVGQADINDVVTYTYTVTNTGNVPVDGVVITDTHEVGEPHQIILSSATATSTTTGPYNETEVTADPLGNNSDAGVNGNWDVLGAGGVVSFTYEHTVTQAEFDAQ